MTLFFFLIICAILLDFILNNFARLLNLHKISMHLPDEFVHHYDENKYALSQKYTASNIYYAMVSSTFSLILILYFIFSNFFNTLDLYLRCFDFSPIITGLLFFGILFLITDLLNIPFAIYQTFKIEDNYGFNKTTPKTFILDKIKSYVLILILGSLILSSIFYFFEYFQKLAWIYASLGMGVFLLLLQPIFTKFIAPLFNTFTPLEDGPLKNQIYKLATHADFPINHIDIMDGSRRSSKGNAYFSGIGKNKRIALFDTLIKEHSIKELISIIAHEIGHYKYKHNIKGMIAAFAQTVLMFYLFSLFINNPNLFLAFNIKHTSIYCSLLLFSFLYSPINMLFSLLTNKISRNFEFQADSFAKYTVGTGKHLISGLIKLTVSNLGNLNPHPLTVWLHYSHPPVLKRIRALK